MWWDSNPHWARPEHAASCRWATHLHSWCLCCGHLLRCLSIYVVPLWSGIETSYRFTAGWGPITSVSRLAGDDGIAPPLRDSESPVPLIYESPIKNWNAPARTSTASRVKSSTMLSSKARLLPLLKPSLKAGNRWTSQATWSSVSIPKMVEPMRFERTLDRPSIYCLCQNWATVPFWNSACFTMGSALPINGYTRKWICIALRHPY